jgi:hypothetical protein
MTSGCGYMRNASEALSRTFSRVGERLLKLRLHSARKPYERALLYPTYGAFWGAWIGVIPIGLDWDRPWQVSTGRTLFLGARTLTS